MNLSLKHIITALALPLSLNLSADDLDNAARGGCECLEAPYAKMAEMQELMRQAIATQDTAQIMAAQGNLSDLHLNTKSCFDSLANRYPEIRASEELSEKINQKMKELCPRPDFGFGMHMPQY